MTTNNNDINIANNVAQRNSQDLERVADTSKTIDHIVDINKKVSLKELWSKRELDGAYYIKNGNGEYEVQIFQDKRKDYRFIGSPISEFVCEVPSYEEWQTTLRYNKALDRDIKNIIEMNGALGRKLFAFSELLKECSLLLIKQQANDEVEHKESAELALRIEEVLK